MAFRNSAAKERDATITALPTFGLGIAYARNSAPPHTVCGAFSANVRPFLDQRLTMAGLNQRSYFLILRVLPSNVVTIACINPSCVGTLVRLRQKEALATHWVANVFSIVALLSTAK
jgi:hypothetical protein